MNHNTVTPLHLDRRKALALLGLGVLWPFRGSAHVHGQEPQLPKLELYKQIDYSEFLKVLADWKEGQPKWSPDKTYTEFTLETDDGIVTHKFKIPNKIEPTGSEVELTVTVQTKPGKRCSGSIKIKSEVTWKHVSTTLTADGKRSAVVETENEKIDPAVFLLVEPPSDDTTPPSKIVTRSVTKKLTAVPRLFSGSETLFHLGFGAPFNIHFSYGVYYPR